MDKYKIVRFYQNGKSPRTIKRGVFLWEAKKHCNDPKTQGDGWLDGFTKEK